MALISGHVTLQAPPSSVDADMDSPESEMEEEVDQLDSDTTEEEDIPIGDTLSSASKARIKKAGMRVLGSSLIPSTRIEKILEEDGICAQMSKEAIFLLSVATEEFVKRFAEAASRHAGSQRRSLINYHDVASSTRQYQEFMFLHDTIPQPLTLAEALEKRAVKEKELADPEHAISITTSTTMPVFIHIPAPTSSTASTPGYSTEPKVKVGQSQSKSSADRLGNGHEPSTNGHTPEAVNEDTSTSNGIVAMDSVSTGTTRRQSQREPKPRRRPDQDAEPVDQEHTSKAPPARNRAPSTKASTSANTGTRRSTRSSGPNGPTSVTSQIANPSAQMPWEIEQAQSAPRLPLDPIDNQANGSYSHSTSNGNSHFDDRRSIFGSRNGITDNPGRTIYSAQRPPPNQ